MRSKLSQRAMICACVMLCAGAIAACGSSSKSSSPGTSSTAASSPAASSTAASSSSGSTASGTSAAVAADEKTPTSIEISTPLKSKPATGKKIIFLRCSQPVCTGFESGLAPAVKALGWTLQDISVQPTPEAENDAVEQAVRDKPAGIFMSGFTAAIIQQGLNAAKAAHIPVVDSYDTNPVTAPIIANVADGAGTSLGPKALADYMAAGQGCKGAIAVFNINTYTILVYDTNVFVNELKRVCPSMKVTSINAQATDVGTKLPAEVTSALQRNPAIKTVAFAFGDMSLGVPAALKAAGLSANVVAYGAGEPTNVQNVANGVETAETAYGITYNAWRGMDALARDFEGMSTQIDTTAPNPGELFVQSNAKSVTGWDNLAVAPNMPAQFEKLWHVG